MKRSTTRSASGSHLLIATLTSIFVVFALLFCAGAISQNKDSKSRSDSDIIVYCAAGIANTIEQIANQFNSQNDFQVRIERVGGSGELAGQIKSENETEILHGASLFISNDDQLPALSEFSKVFEDVFELAAQRPVIAASADQERDLEDLESLIKSSDFRFGVASEHAAIGKLTRQIASQAGLLDELERRKTTDAENVMVLAQAVVIGNLEAAVIWDTTVLQVNSGHDSAVLKIIGNADRSSQTTVGKSVVAMVSKKLDPSQSKRRKKFVDHLRGEDSKQILRQAGYWTDFSTPDSLVPSRAGSQ